MNYFTLIVSLFKIPGCFLNNISITEEEILVEVSRRRKTAVCHLCGKRTTLVHKKIKRKVLHEIIGIHRIFLIITCRYFFCRFCKKRFREEIPFLLGRKRRTENLAKSIISRLRKESFRATTEATGIGYWGLRDCLVRAVNPYLPNWTEEEKKPFSLGIDEHYARKNKYVLSVTNLTSRKPITFLPSDKIYILKKFLKSIPENIKEQIKEVCCDMREGFITAAEEELPKALIVIDHFHLIQDANRRIQEARRIEQDIHKIRINWKIFTKNEEHLREEERRVLARYCEQYPVLHCFYRVKEDLRSMYRLKNRKEASEKLKEIRLRMEATDCIELKLWSRSLRRHEEYILNFFNQRTTNAYTEGIHVKCKLTQRISFGFRNIDVYIRKAMLAFLPLTILNYHHY